MVTITVTEAQIRDLLNRPRGLNSGTVTEYLTIRTNEVTKVVRSSTLYGVASANAVGDGIASDAVKMLVCVDCLRVLVDTAPSFVPDNKLRQYDIRFRSQLESFQKKADAALALVSDKGGTAWYHTNTETRQE
tara:strand:- start:43 stop:441 length:399 start_codon:yes stop_codon:yes gene_type:complete